ncbi:MAG TPA: GGDEF domain-containing protein [Solirubrobacteraceae bacterium]|nr:GGDEF domain-containing protein [Solirubrobacteraceae bacterium]
MGLKAASGLRPALTARLGLRRSGASSADALASRALMARSMMLVFGAGASITALSLIITSSPSTDLPRLITTTVSAYAVALTLLIVYDRTPRWAFPLLLACATVLVEWAIYASRDTTSPYAMFCFWIAIYAFYFFTTAEALGELLFIVISYAVVLSLVSDLSSPEIIRWAITTSALVVAGAMIGGLKARGDRLVAKLADTTRRDGVTGLANVTAFGEQLEGDLGLMRRSRGQLSLLICRLDGLEDLGLRQGEASADELVRQIAQLMVNRTRACDSVARIDRGTFAVIAPHGDQHVGYVLAEQMEHDIRDALPGSMSVNFGVATFPDDFDDDSQLIAGATEALAAAREQDDIRVGIYVHAT